MTRPTSLEVAHWITQREQARLHREDFTSNQASTDNIINAYRFCNVRREDDRVTKWIADHWRMHWTDQNFVAAMLLSRMVNWPPTLKEIGYPTKWDTEQIIHTIHRVAGAGKAWSSAYVITTCGKAMDKALYVVGTVCQRALLPMYRPMATDTLDSFWTRLKGIDGLGAGFLAAQVVADVKYTPLLDKASDWWTWAVPGPGSKRGLNRYFEWGINTNWSTEKWQAGLAEMIREVTPLLPVGLQNIHAQDWQNVMCEYDKWKRVKHGEGRPRQRYTRSDAYPFLS